MTRAGVPTLESVGRSSARLYASLSRRVRAIVMDGLMNDRILRLTLFIVVSMAAPRAAAAQAGVSALRISGSVASGKLSKRCHCASPQIPDFAGIAVQLGVFRPLSPRLAVGVEGTYWTASYAVYGSDRRFAGVSALASWRPDASAGITLEAGGGYFGFRERFTSTDQRSSGVAFEGRLGYRLRLGRTWAIVPFARYLRSVTVTSSYRGQSPGEEIAPSMLSFGASILWH